MVELIDFLSDVRAVAQFCDDVTTIGNAFTTIISALQGEKPDEKSSLELRQDEKEGEKGKEINDPPASAGNS